VAPVSFKLGQVVRVVSSTRDRLHRSCRGKVSHPTREAAEAQVAQLVTEKRTRPGSLTAYYCSYCKGHHVGHWTPVPRRPR
jgi:hypothetical protein